MIIYAKSVSNYAKTTLHTSFTEIETKQTSLTPIRIKGKGMSKKSSFTFLFKHTLL